jgi:hypothetical protein
MKYRFVTIWQIEAPLEDVCKAISHSLSWPLWWHNVESVVELSPGNLQGIGSIRRYTWRGRLPYRLTFDIRVIHIVPLASIEGVASGDVEGKGCWSFTVEGSITIVHYEWNVDTTPIWMNLFSSLLRPLIEWNHNAVMQQGGKALAHLLNARLLVVAQP